MATIPSPITWAAAQKVTAAQMNTNVRDAINFLLHKPVAVVTSAAPQTLTTGVFANLSYDTEQTDSDGMFNLATNPTRLTCVTPGWYAVSGSVTFSVNNAGSRLMDLTINALNPIARLEIPAVTTARPTTLTTATSLFLNVGDYLQMEAMQNSGVSLTTSGVRLAAIWDRI